MNTARRGTPSSRSGSVLRLAASVVLAAGCTAALEGPVRRDLREAEQRLGREGSSDAPPLPDASLESYVRYAAVRTPMLRARLESWRAEVYRIDPARALPDPMVMYGFYFGPDMHVVGVEQEIPWPTKLTRAADAQSIRARAAQRRFESELLMVRMRVAEGYWRLWSIRARRVVEREQLLVLTGLAEAMRGRLEVGHASLAEVSQIELMRSRLDDSLTGYDEQERSAEAALRAAIGAPRGTPMPTSDDVRGPALPREDTEALASAALENPSIASYALLAEAADAAAGSMEAMRFPMFRIGVEAMIAHDRSGTMQTDEGVTATVGVTIPLQQDAYADAERAERAMGEMQRAEGQAAENEAIAELEGALSALRDSHRRLLLFETTLIPQAQAAFSAVVGNYAAGEGNVAATLMAERDLLELAMGRVMAREEHAMAWARLERVVGRPVPAISESTGESDE